jgi:hypothetical protein
MKVDEILLQIQFCFFKHLNIDMVKIVISLFLSIKFFS